MKIKVKHQPSFGYIVIGSGIIGIYHQFQPFLSYIMTSTLIVRSTDRPNELTSGTPGRRNVHGDIYNTLFRIISIPSKKKYFRPPDHVISMECKELDFRCQCTQQKLQSICAVLTFDPQLKKILTFSIKGRYQLNYFICIKDFNAETITSLKLNLFSFFICCCHHHERKTIIKFVFFLYLLLSAS